MAAFWRRAWRSKKVSSIGRLGSSGSGGGGSLWPISGSTTTTASGTTFSTTTTYAATVSSNPAGEQPLVVEESAGEGLDDAMEFKEELVKTRRHLRGLVEEFCGGASGNVTAPDRWLSELNVAWLLHLAELGASSRESFISRSRRLQRLVQSWILALKKISTSIWACFSGFSSQDQEEEATVAPQAAPEFVRFVEATLWKMLTFVGAIIAIPLNVDDPSCQEHIVSMEAGQLRALLDVRDALSSVSEHIMMSFRSSPYVQSTRITDDMGGLLSAELGKLDQAVCDTTDRIRTAVMSSLDDDESSSSSPGAGSTTRTTLQPSPGIHKVTRSVLNCIRVLSANFPHGHQDGLIMEMVASLKEKLTRVSQSFPDQSLRFIFLVNNTYFIQLLDHTLADKIDWYIESYLQVSWAPVLKCLRSPTFDCFMRNYSPLPKFESKFQTTYAAQKLWKVPDPELRKRLRAAIIEKVVSGLTKYLEDNSNRITPGITPLEVKEKLQELFEG